MNNGIYRLIICENTAYCFEVAGGASAENTELQVYPNTENAPAQLFKFVDGITDNTKKSILNQASNKYWFVDKDIELNEQSVKQHSKGVDPNELDWELEQIPGQFLEVNGENIPVYFVYSCADGVTPTDYLVFINSITTGEKVKIAKNTSGKRFTTIAPIKDCFFNSGIVTPQVALDSKEAIAKNTEETRTLKITGSGRYQVRTRYKCLLHNTDTWTEFSDYYSPTGDTTDRGWGDVWKANAYGDLSVKLQSANDLSTTIEKLADSAYDSVTYEVEVRGFSSSLSALYHGFSNVKSIITKQKLSGTVGKAGTVSIGTTGLNIEWSTDAGRTIDKATVELGDIYSEGRKIADKRTVTFDNSAGGVITIPYSELYYYPVPGSKVSFKADIKPMSDYLTEVIIPSEFYSVVADGGDLKPKIQINDLGKYDISVTINEEATTPFDYSECSLIYEHDGKVVKHNLRKKGAAQVYLCAPPLGVDYTIYVYIENKTTKKWGVTSATVTSQSTPYSWKKKPVVVINTINGELAFEDGFDKGVEAVTKSKELTVEELALEGKQYQDVFYGTVQPTKIDVSNAWFKEANRYKIESALNDGYCLLRDGAGTFSYCAIKSINYNRVGGGFSKCSLSLVETAYEVDFKIPY